MNNRVSFLIRTFVVWTLVFVASKPLFMLFNLSTYSTFKTDDWFAVMFHGLPLDFALAGYLTIFPALFLIASLWIKSNIINRLLSFYLALTSFLVSVALVLNAVLYGYWKFPLDSTPLFYFLTSPADAFASVSIWFAIGGIVACLLLSWVIYKLMMFRVKDIFLSSWIKTFVLLLLLTLLLFIPIRGGFTVSSTNTGKAYFSQEASLNHAAVNPLFSLMESLAHQQDFASQYRFISDDEATAIFAEMVSTKSDSAQTVISSQRPNVIIVILESFSNKIISCLGGLNDVCPELDSIAAHGIVFKNFYANSFRTDRGLVSILSGYPAQPTTSLIKFPAKTRSLASIARSLNDNDYTSYYYYGGDVNFTNMHSFLVSQGYEHIVCDKDFPLTERLSKWGVPDHVLFERVIADMNSWNDSKRQFAVVQTSSSHEPFDVPYKRLDDIRLNAFAYTDSVVGRFVAQLEQTRSWDNTLVVFVADHLGAYPPDISNTDITRFQIPLIFTGGVLAFHGKVETYGSQQDLAATLLGQMGIAHDDFIFSKDMFSSDTPHFAFFTVPDALGYADDSTKVVFDNKLGKTVLYNGPHVEKALLRGKAYLQKLYDDIDRR